MKVDELPNTPQDISTIFEGIESKRTKFSNKIFRADQVQISSTKYLIKNWFGYEGLSLVYGSSGAGKTLLALNLGFHVASGVEWFGNRVNRGNVVYIMSEGTNVSHNRIKAIEIKKNELFSEGAHYFHCLNDIVALYSDSNDTLDFLKTVKHCFPRLVVIDTLAMAMSGGDENRTQDIGIVLKNMKKIQQELGCHVMVLHHPGKDESRGARGSSALHAASDTVLELKKSKDVVCVRAVKQRDMEGDKELNFKIEKVVIGEDEDGDEVSSAIIQKSRPTLGTKQEDILNIILSHKDNGISQTQILSRLSDEGKTSFQSNVSRDLAKLEERKCIYKLNNSYFPISKNQ